MTYYGKPILLVFMLIVVSLIYLVHGEQLGEDNLDEF